MNAYRGIGAVAPKGVVPAWTLADRLRKAREAAGHNQAQLAELIDSSKRSVARYEAGESEPRRHMLLAWAMATGTNMQWLETGEAPSPEGNGASDGAPYQNRTGDLFITSRTVRGAGQVVSIDSRRCEAEPLAA